MTRKVVFSPEALAQVDNLETYLTNAADPTVADRYIDRLLDFCESLADEPIIGRQRDDLIPGLMTRTFKKSRVVCFLLHDDELHIIAIFGGRQDWERRLRQA